MRFFLFFIWVWLWRFEKKGFLGLVVGRGFDIEFGACFKKASFLLGLNMGAGPSPGKKICLVNGPGPNRESWPVGQVQVCKNQART